MPFGNGQGQYSIEHIFPQRSSTSKVWMQDIANWGSTLLDMQDRTHVLGNLTAVTNYDNKVYARKRLVEKQKMIKDVAPLKINQSVLDQSDWSAKTVDLRTKYLAKLALERWPLV